MLKGHGRELVREDCDWLGAGIGSWGLSSQVDLLLSKVEREKEKERERERERVCVSV
jgi:hypothetical protein